MLPEPFSPEQFSITDVDTEVHADRLCHDLLKVFRDFLMHEAGFDPKDAGVTASGADYFLREFIIGDRHENIFTIEPCRVRQFAANWYIIRNLEPNRAELEHILSGTSSFYRYLEKQGAISTDLRMRIDAECDKLDYYAERIESFWNLTDDGYLAWDLEVPLKSATNGTPLN